jgi:N-acetylmuramoyl-L-alanine amidase
MSDDKRQPPFDDDNSEQPTGELPASTIFVEMMRQAAARRAAPPEPARDRATRPSFPPPSIPPEYSSAAALFGDKVVIPDPTPKPEPPPRPAMAVPATPPTEAILPEAAPLLATLKPPTAPVRPADEPLAAVLPVVEPLVELPPVPAPRSMEDEAMTEQRIRRVQRRKEQRRIRRAGMIGGFVRTAIVVSLAALLTSTIFNFFMRPEFINQEVASGLQVAQSTNIATTSQPTALPTPNWLRRIGIVSGHRGPQNDPGAVCPPEMGSLTEAEVNFAVATIVVRNLRALGYSVDLLDEFDTRLDNYQAAALVSIHANTCQDFGELVSGYLVAKAAARPEGGLDTLLAECVAQSYEQASGLRRHPGVTRDMTDYHSFREIHALTPAAIIELGFLRGDFTLLNTEHERMAQGITDGILCFLQPTQAAPSSSVVTATPGALLPSPTPQP